MGEVPELTGAGAVAHLGDELRRRLLQGVGLQSEKLRLQTGLLQGQQLSLQSVLLLQRL